MLVNAYSVPVVTDGAVYVGTGQSALVALDAATGVLKTRYATAANVVAAPAIDESVMYVADSHGYVYAFSLAR